MPEKSKRLDELSTKIWAGVATEDEKGEWEKLYAKYDAERVGIKRDRSMEMKKRIKRGKYAEKRIAKLIGGVRKGGPGMADIDAGMFSAEVKKVKKFQARSEKGLAEGNKHKRKEQIAYYVEKCGREARVYLDFRDWLALHGKDGYR